MLVDLKFFAAYLYDGPKHSLTKCMPFGIKMLKKMLVSVDNLNGLDWVVNIFIPFPSCYRKNVTRAGHG